MTTNAGKNVVKNNSFLLLLSQQTGLATLEISIENSQKAEINGNQYGEFSKT